MYSVNKLSPSIWITAVRAAVFAERVVFWISESDKTWTRQTSLPLFLSSLSISASDSLHSQFLDVSFFQNCGIFDLALASHQPRTTFDSLSLLTCEALRFDSVIARIIYVAFPASIFQPLFTFAIRRRRAPQGAKNCGLNRSSSVSYSLIQ